MTDAAIITVVGLVTRLGASVLAFDLAWMAVVLARYWQNGPTPKLVVCLILTGLMGLALLGAGAIVRFWVIGS